MFVFSKFIHFLLHPVNLMLALVTAGLLLRLLGARRGGGWLFGLAGLAAVVFGATPLGESLGYWLEHRVPPVEADLDQVDGAIVLGGPIAAPASEAPFDRYAIGQGAERLAEAARLKRARPELTLVFSGGDAAILEDRGAEAEFASLFFADMGLDPDEILFEGKARNTYENAVYTRELLADRPGRYLLITSAMHMPRALGTFRHVFAGSGVELIPHPVDYDAGPPSWSILRLNPAGRFNATKAALGEIVGQLYYRAMGRSDAWLPTGG